MSGRLVVLMYHRVGLADSNQERRFCTSPHDFARQMQWLREDGYVSLSLERIHSHLAEGRPFPALSIHVTFDDGFTGVLDHALPELLNNQIDATLFAVSSQVGGTNEWMWRKGAAHRSLLSAPQLRLLSNNGVAIGSHSRTHARLTEASPQDAEKEISDSRRELQDMLGLDVTGFAYPYGLYNATIGDMVAAAGYTTACTTRSGFNNHTSNPLKSRRIDVYGTDSMSQFRSKVRFGSNRVTNVYRVRYLLDRIRARFASS